MGICRLEMGAGRGRLYFPVKLGNLGRVGYQRLAFAVEMEKGS